MMGVRVAFRSPFPLLYTEDVGRLLRFYTEALGYEVAYRYPEDPAAPAEFAQVRLNGSGLALGSPRDPLHGLPAAPAGAVATFELCLACDDVDAELARLRRLGVRVLHAPESDGGERAAYVADPDGRPIMIYADPA
jgi:catechol 2,3-dioxygenase-like lactoylglutathione lyase family enzyme